MSDASSGPTGRPVTIHLEPGRLGDGERAALYQGALLVYAPRPTTRALCDHARRYVMTGLAGFDPLRAQEYLTPTEYAELCAPIKPAFIHDPTTRQLIAELVADVGCDLERTYLDVPRMRIAPFGGFLTAGVAYQFPPHRDTWYSAPAAQLNWWLPLWDVTPESTMAFYPPYFDRPVDNTSDGFNYYRWNAVGRPQSARHVTRDERGQPVPRGPLDLSSDLRFVVPTAGLVVFSGSQLHATVPNTTDRARFSIDFRTVDRGDLEAGRGAPNVDAHCTGTALRDFRRGTDGAALPDDLVARFDSGSVEDGVLVFGPSVAERR
jgi:hypothetical protein